MTNSIKSSKSDKNKNDSYYYFHSESEGRERKKILFSFNIKKYKGEEKVMIYKWSYEKKISLKSFSRITAEED